MKANTDTSNACWECTGAGMSGFGVPCRVCDGTGKLSDELHREWLLERAFVAISNPWFKDKIVDASTRDALKKLPNEKLIEIINNPSFVNLKPNDKT